MTDETAFPLIVDGKPATRVDEVMERGRHLNPYRLATQYNLGELEDARDRLLRCIDVRADAMWNRALGNILPAIELIENHA